MDRGKILAEFKEVLLKDSEKARKLIKKLDYKSDPYLLQCIAQTYLDESRFHSDGTQRGKIDWRKWSMAERYIIKAFELDSNCLIVLSTMGSLRRTSAQDDIAIYCFEKIINLGIKESKRDKCELDETLAIELINDAKFELYRLYFENDPKISKKYLNEYKNGLKKGANTIYYPLDRFLME